LRRSFRFFLLLDFMRLNFLSPSRHQIPRLLSHRRHNLLSRPTPSSSLHRRRASRRYFSGKIAGTLSASQGACWTRSSTSPLIKRSPSQLLHTTRLLTLLNLTAKTVSTSWSFQ